jgi:hypothetical protein
MIRFSHEANSWQATSFYTPDKWINITPAQARQAYDYWMYTIIIEI